jgi:hypothetical protein
LVFLPRRAAGEDEVEQLPEAESGAEADQHQARGELQRVEVA